MWDIIIWSDENAIDFVPSIWANEDNTMYKYPTTLSETKIRETIYDSKDLASGFQWCRAELRKRHIKNLQRAKDLCEQGQYTSHFETSDDDRPLIRKKTKRLIEECGVGSMKKQKVITDSEEETEEEGVINEVRKQFYFPQRQTPTLTKKNFENPNSSPIILKQTIHNDEISSNSSMAESNCSTPKNRGTNNLPIELLRTIIRNQAEIKFELKELQKKINEMENRQLTPTAAMLNTAESVFISKFPICTIEAVQEMESLIQEEKLFKELIHLLYLVGGDTLPRVVNGIMKKLFHPEVAVQYSGIGKKHKLPFCSLKLYQAVQVAIRKRNNSTSEQDIQRAVSLYLAQSKARLKSKDSLSIQGDESLSGNQ